MCADAYFFMKLLNALILRVFGIGNVLN